MEISEQGFIDFNRWFEQLGHVRRPITKRHLNMEKAKVELTPEVVNSSRDKDKQEFALELKRRREGNYSEKSYNEDERENSRNLATKVY